jgi:hypothetical protein
MPTAIVTITCPSCGGKVEGIQATDQAQTISCKYCNTELHVPRVGDQIVRETTVVREVVEVQASAVEPLRPRPKSILPAAVVAAIGAVAMLFMIASGNSEADHMVKQFDDERAHEQACRASCAQQCESVPRRANPDLSSDPALEAEVDRSMHEADVMICTMDCETKNDCMHLARSRR